ncbi:hypothetical protein K435DRAFT_787202 [Dendrothele bispora CBS 962.96]|uniref:Uncharacterized protein n=1 Tax=Dendrothele bispora (strain CBS 962.96) TaxID=1314807 RepID=A0A4S8KLT2_DENBC|nr:hypothetical protein K435DRAFT_787202 [Dendrothele bispora CBS 962.96]
MRPTAQEIYASLLLHHGHGYPLWIPEPNSALPSANYAEGIRIGDVGILTPNGGFDYLFNVFLPEDDDINRWRGVPEGFCPLEFRRSLVYVTENQHRPKIPICSQQTKQLDLAADGTVVAPGLPIGIGSGVELKFSRSRGAALMLPEGASRVDYLGLADIRDYVTANTQSWYQFVYETLRLEVDNGSLYVITGFDKTRCYETASFSNSSKASAVSLRFTSPLLVDGNYGRLSLAYSSDLHIPVSSRASDPSHGLDNLSVFIRGFKTMMRKRSAGFRRSKGVKVIDVTKAEPDDVMKTRPMSNQGSYYSSDSSSSRPSSSKSTNSTRSNNSLAPEISTLDGADGPLEEDGIFAFSVFDADPQQDGSGSPIESMESFYHPSDAINEYLLEMLPDANVAVTHDKQWISVLDETDEEFPAKHTLLDRVGDKFMMSIYGDENVCLMDQNDFGSFVNEKHNAPESDLPYNDEGSIEWIPQDGSEDAQTSEEVEITVYESLDESDSNSSDDERSLNPIALKLEPYISHSKVHIPPSRDRDVLGWIEDVKLALDTMSLEGLDIKKIVSLSLKSVGNAAVDNNKT